MKARKGGLSPSDQRSTFGIRAKARREGGDARGVWDQEEPGEDLGMCQEEKEIAGVGEDGCPRSTTIPTALGAGIDATLQTLEKRRP